MTAVLTLIEDAAYAAKVLGQDQTISSGDSQLILRRLNRLLDLRANEKQLVFGNSTETFTMTAGQSQYSTALFTDGRPVTIMSMYVTLNNINYPVEMIDVQKWNEITYKLTESIPNQCYYNPLYPDGQLNFYPLPYAAFTCTADCQYPLTGPLTLATNVTLPPGYEAWIVAELAVDIWPSFKRGPIDQDLKEAQREARAILKRNNYQPLEMNTGLGKDMDNISNAFLYKGF